MTIVGKELSTIVGPVTVKQKKKVSIKISLFSNFQTCFGYSKKHLILLSGHNICFFEKSEK